MKTVLLSIGSNIEPQKNILAALEWIRRNFSLLRQSSVYETDPAGPPGQPRFWNLAAAIETDLPSEALKARLRTCEESLGRTRRTGRRFAPRPIDLDILPEPLTADHRRQDFVMIPLAEIEPRKVDAATGKTFREIADDCPTRQLRKIFPEEPAV